MATNDSTRRFTERVSDYERYRPSYPPELAATLQEETGVGMDAPVADVGSGTGISSDLLLECGWRVWAVEPNRAMRSAAARRLGHHPRFRSVEGTAEATGLPSASVDLVVCAQAFHWFDQSAARREFRRILRPGGQVALIWNRRETEGTPFSEAYERFLVEHGTDYTKVDHRRVTEDQIRRFLPIDYRLRAFPNAQVLDWDGLRGRVLSSSYIPAPGHHRHRRMLDALRELFDVHQSDGEVRVTYSTELHLGTIGGTGGIGSEVER